MSDYVATGIRIGGADTLSVATILFVVLYLSSDQNYIILYTLHLDIPRYSGVDRLRKIPSLKGIRISYKVRYALFYFSHLLSFFKTHDVSKAGSASIIMMNAKGKGVKPNVSGPLWGTNLCPTGPDG